MKKILIILIAILTFAPMARAQDNYISLLSKINFERKQSATSDYDAVKEVLSTQEKYSNAYNLEGLKALYAKEFMNADGFTKDIFFSLIKKTWDGYPDIKYKSELKKITLNGDFAIAEVLDFASATTSGKSASVADKGLLESTSESIYYLQKFGDNWLIVSDYIVYEKTFLRYGSAKQLQMNLTAPVQVPANTDYTASLSINPPSGMIVIASIGKENITHPQAMAPEVFRKLPYDGVLERMFHSNSDNINEYAVASIGLTRAEIKDGVEIKVYVTGLGFVMTRVNVIPKNKFIKKIEEKVEIKANI